MARKREIPVPELTVNEEIALLYQLESKRKLYSNKDYVNETTKKMEDFVGTKAQYDKRFQEVFEEVKNQKRLEDEKALSLIKTQWKKIERMVSEEENVSNSPKLELAWSMAYNECHSTGYYDIVNHFRHLAQLLR